MEGKSRLNSIISIESILLAAICLADMITTVIMVSAGIAVESNPIMSACLRHGPTFFIVVKLISFVPFIVVTEWYRRKNPAFSRAASRAAIVIYMFAYITLTARVNLG
jgi:hypothetical protein